MVEGDSPLPRIEGEQVHGVEEARASHHRLRTPLTRTLVKKHPH
jgi:hypothetical protein